ncbi:hypothetical protein IAT40_004467 [Kwoniella sp. CBS 6097]
MLNISSLQARWALDIFVVILSSIGVISAIPSFKEETESYYPIGDVRGPMLILGSVGVMVALLSRIGSTFTPPSWKPHTDRLEFMFIAMLWICWTSATMSFSLFTLNQSTCLPSLPDHMLPSCPLLTFDLTLLHLLSISSFIQLLMIFSSILSTSSGLLKDGESGGEGFVMWELALASPPHSPQLLPQQDLPPFSGNSGLSTDPTNPSGVRSYGATSTSPQVEPTMPGSQHGPASRLSSRVGKTSSGKRDKFAIGRLRTYIPLSIVSLSVGCGAIASNLIGVSVPSGILLAVVAFLATLLSIACISTHFAQRKENNHPLEEGAEYTYRGARLIRALEVGSAGILFILWPVAAIFFSLAPPSPTRACTNPAASAIPSPGEDSDIDGYPLCTLGWAVISLSWVGSWLLLVRIMGLIFPMPLASGPGLGGTTITSGLGSGVGVSVGDSDGKRHGARMSREGQGEEEGRALLGGSRRFLGNARSDRAGANSNVNAYGDRDALAHGHSKGWQRVIAGEEFELGDDDDDDTDEDNDNGDDGNDYGNNHRQSTR